MDRTVWIVVLNWNGRDDTLALLKDLSDEPAVVVVVDNGSADGTLEAVRDRFPDVRTLQTGANLGYSGGNNAGIELALTEGADVIGVLNNDTLVEPGFLAPLIAEVAEGRSVAVSPDIRYANAPGLSWFRGSRIDRRQGCPLHLSIADQPPPSAPATPSPVLTGCCIVADAATWRRVGLFDDRLFLVFEDSDWSRRAVADGVELLVVPASRIQHKVSRSFTGTAGRLGGYYFARNGLIFAWRHLGRRSAARFFLRQVVRPATRQLLDPARRADGALSWLGALAAVTGRRGPAGGVVLAVAASSHPSRRTSEPS